MNMHPDWPIGFEREDSVRTLAPDVRRKFHEAERRQRSREHRRAAFGFVVMAAVTVACAIAVRWVLGQ